MTELPAGCRNFNSIKTPLKILHWTPFALHTDH